MLSSSFWAPLPRCSLLDPVVKEVAEGLRGRRGVSDASLDFFDLDLMPAQFCLRAPIVVEDGALPRPVLIEPSDAPLVSVLGGLRHDRAPCSEHERRSPAAPARSSAGSARSEAAWPKSGPGTKNARCPFGAKEPGRNKRSRNGNKLAGLAVRRPACMTCLESGRSTSNFEA
jgi:hypothetical protein